jgi:hypothetical protein
MGTATSANAKLETLFCESEAFITFEKFLTCMNERFKELEDAEQPLFETQRVNWLLRGIKNNDIQMQTTIGIIRNSCLSNFDSAWLTLSRTVSARFASVEPNRHKRSIGATELLTPLDAGVVALAALVAEVAADMADAWR